MTFTFKKATKLESKGRIALTGPSGAGKTLTALKFARVLAGPAGRIAVIDTEKGSASKYSDKFEFDVLELTSFAPLTYVEAIKAAEAAGYDVIVVDSLTHAWSGKDGAMEQVDKIKARSRGGDGNGFTAWKDVTPMHNALIDAMTGSTAHVVATMRSKMEYVIEEDSRGKKVPRKVGMAPEQRAGMEYEFDLVGDMDQDHRLVVSKSRCDELADAVVMKPGPETAEVFRAWLSGAPRPAPQTNTLSESTTQEQASPPPALVIPAQLASFYASLPDLADADAAANLWHEQLPVLDAAVDEHRNAARVALVRRVVAFGGGTGTPTAAKNALKTRLDALAAKALAAATPAAPIEAAPVVDPVVEAPAAPAAEAPAAPDFVVQLARCDTLDAVAALWIAAASEIAKSPKPDQNAAWGAAVDRLAVINHCEPSKALGALLNKRVRILNGTDPDPSGPKGDGAQDTSAPADAHGHGEHASAHDAAPAALHRVLDTDTGHIQIAGTWRESPDQWAPHLAEKTVRRAVEASVGCNGAALGPRFLMLAATRIVALDDAKRPPGSLRLTVHGVLATLERLALDGSRDRAAAAARVAQAA